MQPEFTIFLKVEKVLIGGFDMSRINRKNYLDNIRWITILVVVIFHIFFYYNNIGVTSMFMGLADNPSVEGAAPTITFAGIYQYAVYQWFMLLL